MIRFHKVSYEQFKKDIIDSDFRDFSEEEIKEIYSNIKIPKRATKGSAGYDLFAPYDLIFDYNIIFKFPTGIRCEMDDNVVLILVPRSSLGFKYRLGLDNTLGIIDSDYFYAKNEGHIQCKMTQNKNIFVKVNKGEAYMQGIFINYLKTDDDETNEIRVGGFGSTNKNNNNKEIDQSEN